LNDKNAQKITFVVSEEILLIPFPPLKGQNTYSQPILCPKSANGGHFFNVLVIDYSVQPAPRWTYEGRSRLDLYNETYSGE